MNRFALCACWLILLAGCGGGGYEEKLQQRVSKLKQTAPYLALNQAPVLLPDSNFSVRLPKQLTTVYNEDSPHPQDQGRIDPQRVQPPFLSLPGFKLCYEALERDQTNRNYPWYCYLALEPLQPEDRPALESALLEKLKNTFPDAAWNPVDVVTIDGSTIAWKRIAVKGQQPFKIDGNPATLPGTFELWLHETKTAVVLIAWRIPDVIMEKVNFAAFPEPVAGSFTIHDQAPAGQPDAGAEPPK